MRALTTIAGHAGSVAALQRVRRRYEPVAVVHVDVTRGVPRIDATNVRTGLPYRRALSYVRWGTEPVGSVMLETPNGGLDAELHAAALWVELEPQLSEVGARHGVRNPPPLTADGYRGNTDQLTPTEPLSVTVIIATRDRAPLLDRALQSLLELDYPSFDIVVVDNAPATNETEELLRSTYRDEPRVSWVREERPGLGAAHNRGLRVATGDIVAFTDDDVVVDAQWLRHVSNAFADEDVACVTGAILPAELDTQAQWWLETYAGFSKGTASRTFDIVDHRPDDELFPWTAGRLGSGANMSFRRSVLVQLGGFDGALGTGSGSYGGDDLSAFFEVVSSGHRLVYEPRAFVYHRHPASQEALEKNLFGYGAGLTAYLTKSLVDDPRRLVDMGVRVPRALWYGLARSSSRNARVAPDFPLRLRAKEWAGMAVGPFAYVRTRLKQRVATPGRR